jgi:CRP-like cAMP-binding protein
VGIRLQVDSITGTPLTAAFRDNHLLATLDSDARALIEPHLQFVELDAGETVLKAGALVDRTVFPIGSLMVSMVVELSGGRSVEVASIGREGAIGGIVSCGTAPAFTHARVLIEGPAAVMPMGALELAKRASPQIHRLFCRYADFLLAQVMQSVACNAHHALEARTARWLLTAQDRVGGERIPLTQEELAALLGVQRTTVNAVARVLQDQGLISYRRGAIQICDRARLRKAACECHGALEQHYARVVDGDRRESSRSTFA